MGFALGRDIIYVKTAQNHYTHRTKGSHLKKSTTNQLIGYQDLKQMTNRHETLF